MANEIRGAICEAVAVAALELIKNPYQARISWGTTPAGLSVCESDISIFRGRKLDGIFQVTSSGYAGNYQMKFWRDLGELFEIRRVYPDIAIINIIFESEVKHKLVEILEKVSDGVVKVADLKHGRSLVDKINKLSQLERYKTAKKQDRINLIKKDVNSLYIKQLSEKLSIILGKKRSYWNITHVPAKKVTEPTLNLRKAFLIGRLFCEKEDGFKVNKKFFESVNVGKTILSTNILNTYSRLGLCKKVIGGVRVTNEDLLAALKEFGVDGYIDRAEVVFHDAKTSRIDTYVSIIQNLDTLTKTWYQILHDKFTLFCNRDLLENALYKNFDNPSYLMPHGVTSFEPWIFRRILDVIRASRKKHFCIGVPTFDAIYSKLGIQPLRFTISDYLAGKTNLAHSSIKIIAKTLATELQKEASFFQDSNEDRFFAEVSRSELTQRFYAYRGIHPAQALLRYYYKVDIHTVNPPILADFGITGAGGCKAELKEGILSLVQNASESGVGHKVNEVVGRAGLLSLKVRKKNGRKEFYFDPTIVERVLYVDGLWKTKDLEAVASGAFTKVVSLS